MRFIYQNAKFMQEGGLMKYIDLIGKIETKENEILSKNDLFKEYKSTYENSNTRII